MNERGFKRMRGLDTLALSATDINVGQYDYIDTQGYSFYYSDGVPTASASGFAKGCIAIDYTNGSVYYNSGSITSATWTGIGGGSTSTINYDATLTDATAALDATLRVTTQTASKPVLTIPDMAGGSDTFCFIGDTQTLTNKTLTDPDINGGTADLLTSLSVKSAGAFGMKLAVSNTLAAADRTLSVTLASDANQTIATPVGLTSSKLIGYTSASTSAQGEVIFMGATAWSLLGVGTAGQALLSGGAAADVYWGSPSVGIAASIQDGATLEDAGANDAVLAFTTQTVGAPTLTVPNFASVNDTFTFNTLAATLANKTLTTPIIVTTGYIADAGGDEYLMFTESATPVNYLNVTSADTNTSPSLTAGGSDANINLLIHGKATGNVQIADGTDPTKILDVELNGATASKTMTITASHTDDRALTLPDATDTLVGKATSDTLTNKVLSDSTCTWGDNGDTSKAATWSLAGATASKTMTITSSHTDDRALTLPDATDTLVGKATTDTFTNKTIDADGSGNAISNINADELDPVAIPAAGDISDTVYVTNSQIIAFISNQAAAVTIYNANAPFKFMITDAHSIATTAHGGSWKLNNGNAGGGTDITNAVAVAASDTDIDRAASIDDAAMTIAASGSLSIIPDGAGLLDCYIIIDIIRLA